MKLDLINEAPQEDQPPRQQGETFAAYYARLGAAKKAREEAELEAWAAQGDEPEIPDKPGEVEERTGETLQLDPKKNKIMQVLDIMRGMGGEKWSRRGKTKERFGKRIREKDTCQFGHTCDDPSNPMPSPAGPGSKIFSPLTGAPKEEYLEYYLNKNKCPVCSEREPGCKNKVSHEFGRPKPYCSEHLDQSEHVANLMKTLEGEPGTGAKEAQAAFKTAKREHITTGDEVKYRKLMGKVIDIDPEMEGGRTHRIKWENPKAEALRITWVDPGDLDLRTPPEGK